MEGRFPHGVRLVWANCTDPSRAREFNRWYDQVHIPDLVGAGVTSSALRYQNATHAAGDATYLAIWEIENEDLDAAEREFGAAAQRLRAQGRMHPTLEVVRRGMWRRIGPAFSSGKTQVAAVAGIWLVETACTDPERENDFNAWYDATHIPDVLGTGLFSCAYRFAALGADSPTSFLAIYETAIDPVDAGEEFARVYRLRLRDAGRFSELVRETRRRGTFRRLSPTG